MALAKGHRANLETIVRAAQSGDLAVVECLDAGTGKPVPVLCAIGSEGENYIITPFARMFEGNPYDELLPPSVDDEAEPEPNEGEL